MSFQDFRLRRQSRLCSLTQRSENHSRRQSQSGQIVVEYVLLLAITVSLAVLITKTLIGRDPGSPGLVLSAWQQVLMQIGSDYSDDVVAK